MAFRLCAGPPRQRRGFPFGIPADELRHGTFGRIRIVIHMDGLDEYLQSDRERVREGPVLIAAQNVLRAIFNKIRPALEKGRC